MYNLVIVESPSKAKTIEGYLGKDYKVVSSVGHIRDLATTGPGGLGIDVENNYKPEYKAIRGKKKVINEIVKLAKKADKIYIATDPDREGEAIGWHLADEIGLDLDDNNRIAFLEITKSGVQKGLSEVSKIDMDLVHSQETRRMIDRIMGFKLSKLLQKKIKAKSAGRVQSVALRMIVEREIEIREFIPEEYWKLFALAGGKELAYIKNDKRIDKEEIHRLYDMVNNEKFLTVSDIKKTKKKQRPKVAFTTSTLQQTAINRLNFSSKRTMMTAQRLYEGVEINGQHQGLITYMRTDSIRLSNDFVSDAKKYIVTTYGENYVGDYRIKAKKENVQDAHEAIRPTNLALTPSVVKPFLENDQYRLYELIWKRTISAIMAEAQLETAKYIFVSEKGIEFKASNTTVLFDGYRKLFVDQVIEDLNNEFNYVIDQKVNVEEFQKTQHFTQPKPRYTEARLIKTLEENGVGRPSTYASIIETLKARNYVDLEEKRFIPTESGELVVNRLIEFFGQLVNVEYTSHMEHDLDLIAEAKKEQLEIVDAFYHELEKLLENAETNMEKIEAEKTGEKCPECGSDLVIRKGKYGDFVACSNFPKCRYIKQDEEKMHGTCPECEEGQVVEKNTKRKKVFYGCNRFPKCKYAEWELEKVKADQEDPEFKVKIAKIREEEAAAAKAKKTAKKSATKKSTAKKTTTKKTVTKKSTKKTK